MADEFNPYYTWLGIPLAEQPANHYRLLGLALFESDEQVIAHAADRQMGFVRTFQSGPHSAASQAVLNALAAAKLCLLNPSRRAGYDSELRSTLGPQTQKPPEPAVTQPPSTSPLAIRGPTGTTPPSRPAAASRAVPRAPAAVEPVAASDSSDEYSLADPIEHSRDSKLVRHPEQSVGAKLPTVMMAAGVFVVVAVLTAVFLFPGGGEPKPPVNGGITASALQKPPTPSLLQPPARHEPEINRARDIRATNESAAGDGRPATGPSQSPPTRLATADPGIDGADKAAMALLPVQPPGNENPNPAVADNEPMDVLAALDRPDRQLPGWHWERGKLVNDPSPDPRFLPLPFAVPRQQGQDAYVLEAVVERKAADEAADGPLVFSLPGPDGALDLLIDVDGQKTGLGHFEGAKGTWVAGRVALEELLPMEATRSIVLTVSQKSIRLDCNGRRMDFDATAFGANTTPKQPRPRDRIAIGSRQSFVFSKLELKSLDPRRPATPLVPHKEPPDIESAGGPNVNLLALIEPERDTSSGRWKIEEGELVSEGFARQWRTIEIPFRPTGAYKLVLKCAADPPQSAGVVMGLLYQGQQFSAGLDPEGPLAGLAVVSNPGEPFPRFLKFAGTQRGLHDQELSLEYFVGPQCWFLCNDRIMGATPDEFPSCSLDPHVARPAADRLFLSCKGTRFTVHQLEFQPFSGTPPSRPGKVNIPGFNPGVAGANRGNPRVAAVNRFNPGVAGVNRGNVFRPPPAAQEAVPITPSPNLVANETTLNSFDTVDVQSGTSWWKGQVIAPLPDGTVRIRYVGREFDEVVTRSRLRLPAGGRAGDDPAVAGAKSQDIHPVPPSDRVADALEKVKETYKDSHQASGTPEQKIKLADQLLADVKNQKDDATAYAMFTEARQLALDAGRWEAALKAADKLDTRFQTGEPGRLQADVMLAAARSPGDDRSTQQLIEKAFSLAQTMMQGLTYATTKEVTEDFVKAAVLAADAKPEVKKQVLPRATQTRAQIRKRFPPYKPPAPTGKHMKVKH